MISSAKKYDIAIWQSVGMKVRESHAGEERHWYSDKLALSLGRWIEEIGIQMLRLTSKEEMMPKSRFNIVIMKYPRWAFRAMYSMYA